MNDQMLKNCTLLTDNRELVKSVFTWDSGLMHLACAAIYVSKGKQVNVPVLRECKELLSQKVGVFSNFRSTARSPIVSMLAVSEDPERTLKYGLQVYQLLKKEFWSSSYLPLTAMVIAQMADPSQYESIASRTKKIYNLLKSNHPFLTSQEDSANCALLALSDKPDHELINDMESCYQLLRPNFFSSNAIQSLSHVLALDQRNVAEKCKKTMELFNGLKYEGYKYGTYYELPTLGVLALIDGSKEKMIKEIIEVNNWLSHQKGFGFFSSISSKQRLMYAGIVTQLEYMNTNLMESTVVNSTISLIIAQNTAMCAAITASTAAAASTSAT